MAISFYKNIEINMNEPQSFWGGLVFNFEKSWSKLWHDNHMTIREYFVIPLNFLIFLK